MRGPTFRTGEGVVRFADRGAGFDIVWQSFGVIAALGSVFFAVALFRFRRTVAVS